MARLCSSLGQLGMDSSQTPRGVFRPHLNPVTHGQTWPSFRFRGAASHPEAPPSRELLPSPGHRDRSGYLGHLQA